MIIGGGTTVSVTFPSTAAITGGFVSINFSISPSVERLFELGSFDAFDTQIQTQESMSFNIYGGVTPEISLAPSTTCDDSPARADIVITPASCTVPAPSVISRTGTDALFITSYSYSKDFQGYGQESWSLQSKPIISGFTGSIAFIQGFADGNKLTGADIVSDDGVTLVDSATSTTGLVDATGRNISVSAGALSLGTDDEQDFGRATVIGGAVGKEDGKRGTSSANVPHQAVFF